MQYVWRVHDDIIFIVKVVIRMTPSCTLTVYKVRARKCYIESLSPVPKISCFSKGPLYSCLLVTCLSCWSRLRNLETIYTGYYSGFHGAWLHFQRARVSRQPVQLYAKYRQGSACWKIKKLLLSRWEVCCTAASWLCAYPPKVRHLIDVCKLSIGNCEWVQFSKQTSKQTINSNYSSMCLHFWGVWQWWNI